MSSKIVPLQSTHGVQLAADVRNSGGVTALLGSAISAFEPSGIPMGWRITAALAARLGRRTAAPREVIRQLLRQTAFEHVMQRCPASDRLRDVLAASFRNVTPNDVHRAFARLTVSGVVRHLVTTNYDTCLESAFAQCAPSIPLALIRAEREVAAALGGTDPVLFKIHGCATDPFRDEIAFRLQDEAELPSWKQHAFAALAKGRPLLVAGYSGLDFEICSEIASLGPSTVIWLLYRAEDMTANARRTVDECGGVFLQGDVRRLAEMLENTAAGTCAPRLSGERPRVVRQMFAQLTSREIDEWRAALYGEIGCAHDTAATGERLLASAVDDQERGVALALHARGLFHAGEYRDAAMEYRRSIALLQSTGTASELRGAMHGFVESSRLEGKIFSAAAGIRKMRKWGSALSSREERSNTEADVALLTAVLWELLYRVAVKLRLPPLRKWLRTRAMRHLATAAANAAKRGEWLHLQQIQMWSERYGLEWRMVHSGRIRPLPSEDGYGQLGYVVAQAMAYRRTHGTGGIIDAATLRRGAELLSLLIAIGARPEAWKIARLLSRRTGETMTKLRRECQYRAAARILYTFFQE